MPRKSKAQVPGPTKLSKSPPGKKFNKGGAGYRLPQSVAAEYSLMPIKTAKKLQKMVDEREAEKRQQKENDKSATQLMRFANTQALIQKGASPGTAAATALSLPEVRSSTKKKRSHGLLGLDSSDSDSSSTDESDSEDIGALKKEIAKLKKKQRTLPPPQKLAAAFNQEAVTDKMRREITKDIANDVKTMMAEVVDQLRPAPAPITLEQSVDMSLDDVIEIDKQTKAAQHARQQAASKSPGPKKRRRKNQAAAAAAAASDEAEEIDVDKIRYDAMYAANANTLVNPRAIQSALGRAGISNPLAFGTGKAMKTDAAIKALTLAQIKKAKQAA
jgi:hypothetical protein